MSRKSWKQEDYEIVKNNIHLTYAEIGKIVGATKYATETYIRKHLELLQARPGYEKKSKFYNKNKWTDEEIKILKEKYPRASKEEISELLTRWNWDAICRKAEVFDVKRDFSYVCENYREGVDRFSKKEIKYIVENYSNTPKEEMIDHLGGREWFKIQTCARDKGGSRGKERSYKERSHPHEYTEEEIKTLKDNIELGPKKLAKLLDRSPQGIKVKVSDLNLEASWRNKVWREYEIKILEKHYPTSSPKKIMKLLNYYIWENIRAAACHRGFKRKTNIRFNEEQMSLSLSDLLPNNLAYQNRRDIPGLEKLELDWYCPSLSLAFEYNGVQHYDKDAFTKNNPNFVRYTQNDKRKKELCKKAGIELVVVKYDDCKSLEAISKKLNEVGIEHDYAKVKEQYEYIYDNNNIFYDYSDEQLSSDFDNFKLVEVEWEENTIKGKRTGYKIVNQFFPNRMKGKRRANSRSPHEAWQDPGIRRMLYKKNPNPTLNQIRMFFNTVPDLSQVFHFKPEIAKAVYEKYCPKDSIVYDFSSGFGSRLLAAAVVSNVKKYIGTDPNTATYYNLIRFQDGFISPRCEGFEVEIYNKCSEDFCPLEYVKKIDVAFSSPPYFDLEKYSIEDTQSYKKHPKYPDWLEGYWLKTIINIHTLLKDDGILIVNVNDILKNKEGKPKYPLINDMIYDIAGKFFDIAEIVYLQNLVSNKRDFERTKEPIFILKKK